MKNIILSMIAVATLLTGPAMAKGIPGICSKSSCGPKANSPESFTISYKHRLVGIDHFILPASQKEDFLNDQMKLNDKKSFGVIIKGMTKEGLGVRLDVAKESVDYSIMGRDYGESPIYRATRDDVALNVGIEKHFHINKALRIYLGPNIPMKVLGKARSDSNEVEERSERQGSIGGGLTMGLYCKVLKVLTIGADFEGYAIPTQVNLEIADEFAYQKFTHLGANANITLGLAF